MTAQNAHNIAVASVEDADLEPVFEKIKEEAAKGAFVCLHQLTGAQQARLTTYGYVIDPGISSNVRHDVPVLRQISWDRPVSTYSSTFGINKMSMGEILSDKLQGFIVPKDPPTEHK